jgi:hypothetical protein
MGKNRIVYKRKRYKRHNRLISYVEASYNGFSIGLYPSLFFAKTHAPYRLMKLRQHGSDYVRKKLAEC